MVNNNNNINSVNVSAYFTSAAVANLFLTGPGLKFGFFALRYFNLP